MNSKSIIEKRNKSFRKATRAQKRVMLAQDVLSHLNTGKFWANTGSWIYPWLSPNAGDNVDDKSLREAFFDGDVRQCDVCALGSLMTSCVLFKNRVKVKDARLKLSYSKIHKGGKDASGPVKLFGKKQLTLIELAFERGYGLYRLFGFTTSTEWRDNDISRNGVSFEDANAAQSYFLNDTSSGERLAAIMQNIVKNKGKFVV